jgi:hypothetical protein
VSAVITEALALSNDRSSLQRIRDLKAHLLEYRRESGSLFQDTPWGAPPHSAKQARGIRWAELEGIELYRRHDQLRWFIDAPTNDVTDDQRVAKRADPHTAAAGHPHGVDSALAWEGGFEFHEVDEALKRAHIRALVGPIPSRKGLSPRAYALAYKVREERVLALAKTMTWTDVRKAFEAAAKTHRKPGRKPIGLVALTVAERVRKHRRNKVLPKAPATHGRRRPGADQRGLPLPLPAPGYFIPTRGGLIRVLGGSTRISTPSSGVVMMTPVPTPQQATSSLIGARTIPPLSEGDATVIVLALERHARAVRAREAKRSVLAWRAAKAAKAATVQA